MTRADLARHTDFLAGKTGLPQLAHLRSSGKIERMLQTRYIQLQRSISRSKCATHNNLDFRRRKTCIVDRFGNQNGIEGFSSLRVNRRLTFYQIDISMTNAIQAFEGLLGPFRSKPSYHAVDLDGSTYDLRWGGRSHQKTKQPK